jgi:hypothetical protein
MVFRSKPGVKYIVLGKTKTKVDQNFIISGIYIDKNTILHNRSNKIHKVPYRSPVTTFFGHDGGKKGIFHYL